MQRIFSKIQLNPRTYTQSHFPFLVQEGMGEGGGGGGLMELLPRVFDILEYFKKILPSVESLWSSRLDEVQ